MISNADPKIFNPKNKIPSLDANHIYRVEGAVKPGVTQILAGVGLSDFSAPWFSEEARKIGEIGHKCIYLVNDNDLDWDSVDPSLIDPLKGYQKAKEEIGFKIILNEQRLYSELYGFCGTLDAFVWFPTGKYGIIDWKFGAAGTATKYQLELYTQLLCENWMQTKLYPFQVGRFALENIGSGKPKLKPFTDKSDRDVALAAVTLFNAKVNDGIITLEG